MAAACLQSAAMTLTGSYLTADELRTTLIDNGDAVTDGKVAITKPRVNLDQAFSTLVCDGLTFTIYNDGNSVLDITDVNSPAWASVSRAVPFSIAAGASKQLCVQGDCNSCAGLDLARWLKVYSNDLDMSPHPDGVTLSMICSKCGPIGNLDGDCDEDLNDFSIFSSHWFEVDCAKSDWCGGADLTRNQIVDFADMTAFFEEWLGEGLP